MLSFITHSCCRFNSSHAMQYNTEDSSCEISVQLMMSCWVSIGSGGHFQLFQAGSNMCVLVSQYCDIFNYETKDIT